MQVGRSHLTRRPQTVLRRLDSQSSRRCGSPDHSHRRPAMLALVRADTSAAAAAIVVDDHPVTAYTTDHEPREQVACGMPTPAGGPSRVLQQRFEQLPLLARNDRLPRSLDQIAVMRPVAGDARAQEHLAEVLWRPEVAAGSANPALTPLGRNAVQ